MATINAKVLIERDTTENWGRRTDFIPQLGEIILYTDYKIKDGIVYPGLKIGDGLAYLIDLPFLGDEIVGDLQNHIFDSAAHISDIDRMRWNNKVDVCVNGGDNLVFTKTN